MKRTGGVLVVAIVIGVSAPVRADGFGEFLGRLNPVRFFSRSDADDRRPEAPGADQLREQLAARGLDDAEIDERIAKIEAARENGMLNRQAAWDGSTPDLEELRARLEERGLDEAEIDARIARIEAALARRTKGDRDMAAGELPDLDRLRAKLEERGIDPSLIDERIARIQGALDRRGQLRGRQSESEEAFGVDGDQVRQRMPPIGLSIGLEADGPELTSAAPSVVGVAGGDGDGVEFPPVRIVQQHIQQAVAVSDSPGAVTRASATAGDTPPVRPTFDRANLRERMEAHGLSEERIEQRLNRISQRGGGRR